MNFERLSMSSKEIIADKKFFEPLINKATELIDPNKVIQIDQIEFKH